ncbi:MAG: pectinesterase family protein [Ignavibacteriaceae bacterium]|nr:pectinesterase family protein [Ignavibacteriaceae bacterium]
MKLRLLTAALVFLGAGQTAAQSASVVYPLTSTSGGVPVITGAVTARNESFSGLVINNYTGPNSSQRVTTTNGSWPGETGQVSERYIQFAVSPAAGQNFTVTGISMKIGAAGGGNMRANIRIASDSTFASSTLLNASPLVLPNGSFISPAPDYSVQQTIYDGETLYLRIYPWYTSASTGKYVCPQDVTVQGTTAGASVIQVTPVSLPQFGAVVAGTNSASAVYTVSGSALTGDISVTAPEHFQVSSDNLNFAESLILQQSGGVLSGTPVYARFSPASAAGTVSGFITHSSSNAGTKTVQAGGIAIAQEPSVQSAITFGEVTGNSIVVNFSGGNGAKRVIAVRKDSAVSWVPADGTIITGVSSNYLSAEDKGNGNKVIYNGPGGQVTVTGLSSNVLYHFALFEYNEGTGNSANYLIAAQSTGSQTTLAVPTITLNPADLAFGNVGVGIYSPEKSYTVSAATLSPSSGVITVNAPAGYQISLASGSGFSSSVNLPYSGGSLAVTTVYVRFMASALVSYAGEITHTGGSAPAQSVTVSGAGMIPNAQQAADIIVSQDGTGNFTTIQEAINSIPANNSVMKVILIKKGTYNEKIYISNSNITLVGEDRYESRIIYAELRSLWHTTSGGSDWGAATVNINNGVTNLTLANLTIYNNYGSLYGSTDHQFAIRGASADRISIINCEIKADGGDTHSLWNAATGKSYHYNCYFEGFVDFVCPRGWSYISDSRFYQRSASASASIWHDGSSSQNAKFVIRNSRFEGVPNFALGRHHQEAQFFLLDNSFSSAMKNQPIFFAASNPPITLQWGQRYYYFNNHRDSGDYPWHADNLDSAAGSPLPEQITAEWTFSTAPAVWNPEANFPRVLPNAEFPKPERRKTGVMRNNLQLSFVPGRRAASHHIYFGTVNPPPYMTTVTGNSFVPPGVEDTTTYYWRADAVSQFDTVRGEVWSFRTGIDSTIPVELTSFTASVSGKKVNLEWITATETNNRGFYIERKTENSGWENIGYVPGKGTVTYRSVYVWTDDASSAGAQILWYRLRQIDFDGTSVYLKEVKADIGKPGSYQLHQNFPNPFNPATKIKFEIPESGNTERKVSLKIYDSLGREVKTLFDEEKGAGYYEIDFADGALLASGIYFYQLRSDEFVQTRKMTLIR